MSKDGIKLRFPAAGDIKSAQESCRFGRLLVMRNVDFTQASGRGPSLQAGFTVLVWEMPGTRHRCDNVADAVKRGPRWLTVELAAGHAKRYTLSVSRVWVQFIARSRELFINAFGVRKSRVIPRRRR